VLSEEDVAERDARTKRAKEEEEGAALARRPNVDLERLNDLCQVSPQPEGEQEAVQRLIDLEFAQLMKHDTLAHLRATT
jgi:pre-mRNA-splicing factor CDC5/CEF1